MHTPAAVGTSRLGIRPDGGGHGAIALCETRTTKRCVGIPSLGDRVRVIPGRDRVPASARCLSMMRRATVGVDRRSAAAWGRGGRPAPWGESDDSPYSGLARRHLLSLRSLNRETEGDGGVAMPLADQSTTRSRAPWKNPQGERGTSRGYRYGGPKALGTVTRAGASSPATLYDESRL